MKKLFNISLLTLAALVFTISFAEAQKKFTNGTIKFQLVDVEGPEQAMMLMKNTTLNINVNGNLVKNEINMMGGMMEMGFLTNMDEKKGTMLMNMMGKKSAISIDNMNDQMDKAPKFDIEYNKKDTKEIAGYKCHKATIKMEDGSSNVFYVTEKISAFSQFTKQYEGLEGFPLQLDVDQNGMKMTLKATEVSHVKPDESIFKIPAGYEEMTMEEFEKSMKSLGGGF